MERVGVIGARSLPLDYKVKVFGVVEYLVAKGYQINSGGAQGADQFALEALVSLEACANHNSNPRHSTNPAYSPK